MSNIEESFFIHDLDIDDTLLVTFTLNDTSYEFPITIEKILGKTVLFSPMYINEKLITFNSMKNLSLIYVRDKGKPILWENVVLVTYKDKRNNVYYATKIEKKGKEVNRRGAYRIPLAVNGFALIGEHTKAREVVVRDISMTGFSLLERVFDYETIRMPQVGQSVRIKFEDVNFNYHIILEGIVKRIDKLNDNTYSYGCELLKKYKNLDTYINLKQREELSKNSFIGKSFDYSSYQSIENLIQ